MTTPMEEKLNELKKVFSTDLLACDVMISILNSAALSFERDSLLIPFPKDYLKDSVKDFEKLVSWFLAALALLNNACSLLAGRPRKDPIS